MARFSRRIKHGIVCTLTAENIINYMYRPSLTCWPIPEAKRRREEAAAAPRGSSRAGLMAGKRTVLALFIWAMAMVIFMATLHTQGEDVNLVYIYRHVHILINQFVLLQYMQGRIK
jgi:flagellar biosynthesis protein FliQ